MSRGENEIGLAERHCLSILERIGQTPLIKISNIAREVSGVEIYAKAEWFNPGGSIKDRAALQIILDAERSGRLTSYKTILDSTSGNTGIAYAMIGAVKGYNVQLVMPANISAERKKIVAAYGAEVVFTDPMEGSDGAYALCREMYEEDPSKYFWGAQYDNPSNPRAHYLTTGVEIYRQTRGRVTHFVAGIGTTGTLMGTGRRLKEYDESIQVIAVEPDSSLHGIEGLKHMPSCIVPSIYDEGFADRKIGVRTEDAYSMGQRLALEEGLFVGYSSGAVLKACLDLAREIGEGVIVTVFPDGGDKYLSLV